MLLEEPRSLSDIRAHFDVTSSSIIPRIKDLLQASLMVKDDGKYQLTTTGTILAKKLRALDNLGGIIETTGQFLNEHDLSPIPAKLMDRIDELGNCKVITNELEHITATHDQIYSNLPKSGKIMGISPVLDPEYPKIYYALVKRGIPVSIIVTKNIFRKIEKDYSSFLTEYLSCDNAKMYVVDQARLVLVSTDEFLSMYLYNKNGAFDSMNSLYSSDESAVNWGEELFEEYLRKAKEIKI